MHIMSTYGPLTSATWHALRTVNARDLCRAVPQRYMKPLEHYLTHQGELHC